MRGNVPRAYSIQLRRDLDDIPSPYPNCRIRPLHLPEMAPIAQSLQSHDRRLDCVLCLWHDPGCLGIQGCRDTGIGIGEHGGGQWLWRVFCGNKFQRLRSIIDAGSPGIAICAADPNSIA